MDPFTPKGRPAAGGAHGTRPFTYLAARTLCACALVAGLFVVALLLVSGREVAGPAPLWLGTLSAFCAACALVSLHLWRRRHHWSEKRDRTWSTVILGLGLPTGAAILYSTGGVASPFVVFIPLFPFAVGLGLGRRHALASGFFVSLLLAAGTVAQVTGAGPRPGFLVSDSGEEAAAVTLLGASAIAGVYLAALLSAAAAGVLERRRSEVLRFVAKTELRAEKLALLIEMGKLLRQGGPFLELAGEAVRRLHEHLRAEATVLYVTDPEDGSLRCLIALGPGSERESQETVLALSAVAEGTSRLLPEAETTGGESRSVMVVPLVVEERGYGAIKTVAAAGTEYNSSKLALLETVAAELGSVLRTADSYRSTNAELARATQELAALNRFTRRVSASFDVRGIAQALLDAVVRSTDSDYCTVCLSAEDEGGGHVALFHGYPLAIEASLVSGGWRCWRGPGRRAVRAGQVVVVNDARLEGGEPCLVDGVRSSLYVPVMLDSQVAGVIGLESERVAAYGQTEVDFVAAMAESTAVAIRNARLYARLEQLAVKDGLTGLFDHSYFYQSLQAEIERCERHGHVLSLIMLDVDDFKRYNDRYGHQEGDAVLGWLGEVLLANLRKSDLAARYGGEEFVVVMPETPRQDAFLVAEKLRAEIEETQPSSWPDRVTVSVGVAGYPEEGATAADLLRTADTRMYLAKRAGKNRVVAAG
jgi:diguanylate cyclase (GGDEF)-like protein